MVELRVLSGRMAGRVIPVRHFPFRIGRSPESGLQLEDDGVWDRHAEITSDPAEGFTLRSLGEAPVWLDTRRIGGQVMRNGDQFQVGGAKLRFWLSPPRQQRWQLREWATWIALLGLCALQALLAFWLSL